MRGRDLVAVNVRRIRVAKGVSQERLASDSAVDRSYLGGVERGEENPTVDVLDRLAATLAVPIAELFDATASATERTAGLRRGRKPLRP
jgi:transcriptional regulator with XRE-family HTH domain